MDSSKEITKFVKEQGPLHYMLKIETFSSIGALLKGCGRDCITSSEFNAGGCKWVLKIHWNENEGDKDNGHISMFLRLIDKLKPGEVVTAMFRFYVHNQKLGNYFVVQDATGRQFSLAKSEWGISKVLPVSEVMDSSKGYIVDDCCVVGVEVFPAKSEYKVSTLAMVQKNSTRSYTWKVAKFSGLADYRLLSPKFAIDGITWYLMIYPKGDSRANGESLSLFLCLNDEHKTVTADGNGVFVKYKFSIKDQLWNNSFQDNDDAWYNANHMGWGKSAFIPLSDLKNRSKGYLENDELIIQVDFEAILRITSV